MNPERDLIDASVFAGVCEPAPAAEFIDLLLRTGFSPSAYRDRFGDLAARGFDPTQALAHFFKNGLRERRSVPMILDHRALLALARLPISNRWLRVHLLASLGGHLFDPKDTKSGAYIAERWPAVRALREAGARPYFIAGDSHAGWFVHGTGRDDAWLLPIHIPCSAGSARGLANPESVSGYGNMLRDVVAAIQALPGIEQVPFLLQFGQVDLEFVYNYNRVDENRPRLDLDDYRRFCDETVDRYAAFLGSLPGRPNRPPISLISVFPPVLSDDALRGGYVTDDIVNRESKLTSHQLFMRLRTFEMAGLADRTAIHAYFNERLRFAAWVLYADYIEALTPFLGEDGVVRQEYIIPEAKGAEHHMDGRRTYPIAQSLVWACVDAAAGIRPPATPA